MKNVLLMAIALSSQFALADYSGEYVKKNAGFTIKQEGQRIAFSANSVVGTSPCNLGEDEPLNAQLLDKTRAAWTPEDNNDTCMVVMNFSGGGLKVTTKDCDAYCGMEAVGSLDGMYKKKALKRKK